MKIKYLFLALLFMVSAGFTPLRADDDEELKKKINAAVMEVYDKHLKEDPNNYETRFCAR